MNDGRRSKLQDAIRHLDNAKALVEEVQSDEQDSFDNLPQSMQEGDKSSKMAEAIDALAEAADAIDNAMTSIETAKE